MHTQKLFLLISASLIFILTNCSKQCDDFNKQIVDWMPYKSGDRIIISNNSINDTLSVDYSEIYHTDKIGFGAKCSCENSFILKLSSETLNVDIRFNDSKLTDNSEIVVNDDWMGYSEHLDNLSINGKSFTDVIIYKNINPASLSRFEKVIVAKTIGIVAIIGENEEWIIIDNEKREFEISDITFKNSDC